MNEAFYNDLKSCFVIIKNLFSSDGSDYKEIDVVLDNLRGFRREIEENGNKKERKLLLYCIDTLFKKVDEGDREKVYYFADLICNMPDIFLGKRNFYSFSKKIEKYNRRFQERCFSEMNKIRPYFTKKAPKNALEFFSRKSDEGFKALHPIGYWVIAISGIIALFLPLAVYIIYMLGLNGDQIVGGWAFLALLGCMVMGVGLFNIVAAFIHQYLGHRLTFGCLLGGGAMLALSIFMINNPELWDVNVSIYYFGSLFFMLLPAIAYFLFRFRVETWLKRKKRISSSRFRRMTKGLKNYWWYEKLHEETGLGALYYLNKAFIILFVSVFTLTLLTGLIKEMSVIICPLQVTVYILTAIMALFSQIERNLQYYGTPIVIIAKTPNDGIDSVVFDIIMILFVLLMGYLNIKLAGSIWGITLPPS